MKKSNIDIMLKVKTSKKVKVGRKTMKKPSGEFIIVVPREGEVCDIFKENLEGKEKRKLIQLIKEYTISKKSVYEIIDYINSVYVSKPLAVGLIKTVTKDYEILKGVYIDDIEILEGTSPFYNAREKRIDGKKVRYINPLKLPKARLVDQAYKEVMYDEYELYYTSKNKLKSVVIKKKANDMYMSNNGIVVISPVQVRLLNLRVRRPVSIELHTVDEIMNVIYAKPCLKK